MDTKYFFQKTVRSEKNNLLESNLKEVKGGERKNGHQFFEQQSDFNVSKLSML